MNMTTTMTPLTRAEKAQETARRKLAEQESGPLPPRSFVRVVAGHESYLGKVGKVHSHNDLRTSDLPNIPVEVGVVFTPGGGAQPVWFYPSQLTRCPPPPKWE